MCRRAHALRGPRRDALVLRIEGSPYPFLFTAAMCDIVAVLILSPRSREPAGLRPAGLSACLSAGRSAGMMVVAGRPKALSGGHNSWSDSMSLKALSGMVQLMVRQHESKGSVGP